MSSYRRRPRPRPPVALVCVFFSFFHSALRRVLAHLIRYPLRPIHAALHSNTASRVGPYPRAGADLPRPGLPLLFVI
ncbi:hypothetical protein B0H11DRAFT_1029811 [Mycena galericulata]|nr:hypothetical protein B0H11DRAFT_1029811 [Mycena galericulata]